MLDSLQHRFEKHLKEDPSICAGLPWPKPKSFSTNLRQQSLEREAEALERKPAEQSKSVEIFDPHGPANLERNGPETETNRRQATRLRHSSAPSNLRCRLSCGSPNLSSRGPNRNRRVTDVDRIQKIALASRSRASPSRLKRQLPSNLSRSPVEASSAIALLRTAPTPPLLLSAAACPLALVSLRYLTPLEADLATAAASAYLIGLE